MTDSDDLHLKRYLPYQLLVATSAITQKTSGIYAELLGITIAEARVITVVHSFGPVSTFEVAELTKMDKAKISRAIKQLTAVGVLHRDPNQEDKRLITLALTSKGEELRKRLVTVMQDIEAEAFASFTDGEKSELARLLRKIIEPNP
ncbi:winged helix-turn-helix transcriptional regulator [Rhizobium cauense]|uniref:MarR family winged helix-turn-helix transcriptional regulator n=1 Tax=Rhizobium cauense TaxID=1166683 RepID=UPI001C6E0487|nr:MarR family winged helix-turn-helix transcriptional regulator [Rhizobium cauense]MBW9116438.1 winged helix-turn-helix transcriptional regulator [Rhizobium cauense]